MRRKCIFLTIYLLGVLGLASLVPAAPQQFRVFRVKKALLKVHPYPWADELELSIAGVVHPKFAGGVLTLSLYYLHHRVRWFDVPIVRANSKKFSLLVFERKWEVLNNATQEILPGKYTIVLQFLLQNQPQKIQGKYKKILKKKKSNVHRQSFYLGSEKAFATMSRQLRTFYIERMKKLNALFMELQKTKRIALRVVEDSANNKQNPFAETGIFSRRRWRNWFDKKFLAGIAHEKHLLTKHRHQVFFPRYLRSYECMQVYCDKLDQIGRLIEIQLYQFHEAEQDHRNISRVDQHAIKSFIDNIRYIQQLHAYSAQELGINLIQELGYLPPPGVY